VAIVLCTGVESSVTTKCICSASFPSSTCPQLISAASARFRIEIAFWTNVSGQTTCMSSSLLTAWPARLTSAVRVSTVIVIDELGYVPLAEVAAELLLQVIAERAEKAAIIVNLATPGTLKVKKERRRVHGSLFAFLPQGSAKAVRLRTVSIM
jgi:IstB-like ATP binding protein